jgi:hypothetical protein
MFMREQPSDIFASGWTVDLLVQRTRVFQVIRVLAFANTLYSGGFFEFVIGRLES